MARTKKVKAAGKFSARYGKTIRERYAALQEKRVKKQKCPYCKKLGVKRISKGVWQCFKCGKKFTGAAFYLE
jgi:large subunit ribosomal protein L37Ae